ncbi:protein of unknown function [Methylorubrum extorquens]|uniref:Uncharacterized protein n=1 Tax=Methylorubrum extorquens TaxID=408 RepID=A0A2N9AVN1_METEX|nr:protein of unknown function [Methylorubrum extorquens]
MPYVSLILGYIFSEFSINQAGRLNVTYQR